ncbi:MAG: formyltransferase family protein [Chitinophagaceae bacterium]
MFKHLQKKWGISGWSFLLVFGTFALGGSLCGYLGKRILGLFDIANMPLKLTLYIILVTLLWPLCVLGISIFTGQFRFFSNYLKRLFVRIFGQKKIKVAIFASGAGTNAQNIIQYFKNNSKVNIAVIVCNKPNAGVLNIAVNNNIKTLLIEKQAFENSNEYVNFLQKQGITHIVLAGFLWKMPFQFIEAFPSKIINIHPALLPKFGGKGMYGMHVHNAVINKKELESGITIHYVNEAYDEGAIIFQAKCAVSNTETADSLAEKVHQLEYEHFPKVIEQWLKK